MMTADIATALIAAVLNGVDFIAPAALYAQLHTDYPGPAGTDNVSAGSAVRVPITFADVAAGVATQDGTPPTWTNGGVEEPLAYVTLWSAPTGGTCYLILTMNTAITWRDGNNFTLSSSTSSIGPVVEGVAYAVPSNIATAPSGGAFSGTRSPSTGTLSGTFQKNDLVLMVVNCNSGTVSITLPTGWFNLLGGTTVVTSAGNNLAVVGHFITAAEVAAGTTSWTLTNLFAANDSGRRSSSVMRGIDPTNPVGAVATAYGTTDSLVMPNITATMDGSVTVVGGAGDAVTTGETIGTLPAPWTDLGSTYVSGSTPTVIQGFDATLNTAGATVTGPTLSITRADIWVAATIELLPALV